MEKEIKITAKLYHVRDTAKRFHGGEFQEKLKPYSHIIKEVMKANNINELKALLRVSNTKHYQENGFAQMMFIASVVEMIEPSA
jgi:hypothetical protein